MSFPEVRKRLQAVRRRNCRSLSKSTSTAAACAVSAAKSADVFASKLNDCVKLASDVFATHLRYEHQRQMQKVATELQHLNEIKARCAAHSLFEAALIAAANVGKSAAQVKQNVVCTTNRGENSASNIIIDRNCPSRRERRRKARMAQVSRAKTASAISAGVALKASRSSRRASDIAITTSLTLYQNILSNQMIAAAAHQALQAGKNAANDAKVVQGIINRFSLIMNSNAAAASLEASRDSQIIVCKCVRFVWLVRLSQGFATKRQVAIAANIAKFSALSAKKSSNIAQDAAVKVCSSFAAYTAASAEFAALKAATSAFRSIAFYTLVKTSMTDTKATYALRILHSELLLRNVTELDIFKAVQDIYPKTKENTFTASKPSRHNIKQVLNLNKFGVVLSAIGISNLKKTEIRDAFNMIDSDEDGVITSSDINLARRWIIRLNKMLGFSSHDVMHFNKSSDPMRITKNSKTSGICLLPSIKPKISKDVKQLNSKGNNIKRKRKTRKTRKLKPSLPQDKCMTDDNIKETNLCDLIAVRIWERSRMLNNFETK